MLIPIASLLPWETYILFGQSPRFREHTAPDPAAGKVPPLTAEKPHLSLRLWLQPQMEASVLLGPQQLVGMDPGSPLAEEP